MATVNHILKNYLLCSFLLGISLKNPYFTYKKSFTRILCFIPKFIHFSIVIVFLYLLFSTIITSLNALCFYFYLITFCIPNLFSIYWTKTNENEIKLILYRLNRAEKHLKTFIDVPLPFEMLVRSIRFKLIICVILIMLIYIYKIYVFSKIGDPFPSFIICSLMGYKCWILFFVTILIDYNTFLMSSLNNHLNKLQYNFKIKFESHFWALLHLFKHVQSVHYELHKATHWINSCFGWILLAVFVDLFIIATNNIIAILLVILDPTITFIISRNNFTIIFNLFSNVNYYFFNDFK